MWNCVISTRLVTATGRANMQEGKDLSSCSVLATGQKAACILNFEIPESGASLERCRDSVGTVKTRVLARRHHTSLTQAMCNLDVELRDPISKRLMVKM